MTKKMRSLAEVRDTSLEMPHVGLADEVRLVRKEVDKEQPAIYVPALYLKLAVEVMRLLRGNDRLEPGPRASINAALIARSSALLESRTVVSFCNVKEGIYTAVLGKSLSGDTSALEKSIDAVFPDISAYLQNEMQGCELSAMVSAYYNCFGDGSGWNSRQIKKLIGNKTADVCFEAAASWIYQHESMHKYRLYEVLAEYLSAFDRRGQPPAASLRS
ncbi:hypothetical protein ACFL43_04320 [Thermodesulfobacteriota bacterium]